MYSAINKYLFLIPETYSDGLKLISAVWIVQALKFTDLFETIRQFLRTLVGNSSINNNEQYNHLMLCGKLNDIQDIVCRVKIDT